MPRPLYPGERDPVPIMEAGWAPGPVWTAAETLASTGLLMNKGWHELASN
jgi:hypothetical protein